MLPSTSNRVPQNTALEINHRIRNQMEANVRRYVQADARSIRRRLDELEREWDIERTLEANAATVALIGLGLGALVHRRFFVLPGIVAGFLLQHALQGWCPPMPIFRRLGIRTQSEIDEERYALKALRGDFRSISDERGPARVHDALHAVKR